MNFFSDNPELLEILGEARQRRKEERTRQDFFFTNSTCSYCSKIPIFPASKADFYQVDKRAAEAGVEGVAGRALRPRLPSHHLARRPPRLHEGGLGGAGRGLAGLP